MCRWRGQPAVWFGRIQRGRIPTSPLPGSGRAARATVESEDNVVSISIQCINPIPRHIKMLLRLDRRDVSLVLSSVFRGGCRQSNLTCLSKSRWDSKSKIIWSCDQWNGILEYSQPARDWSVSDRMHQIQKGDESWFAEFKCEGLKSLLSWIALSRIQYKTILNHLQD